jgi:uncharacterized membrane protein (Fun14 family)
MDTNDLKINKNELDLKIKDLKKENIILMDKNKKVKRIVIYCGVLTILGYIIGIFTHKSISIAALLFEIASVFPLGIISINQEDKINKNKREIETSEKQISEIEEKINNLETLPSLSISKEETPIFPKSTKENIIPKTKK